MRSAKSERTPRRSYSFYVPAGVVLIESGRGEPALGIDSGATGKDKQFVEAPGLLESFLRLEEGESERFLAFARRYGFLNLCEHDLPASHYPLPCPSLAEARRYSFPCFPVVLEPGGVERIDSWRHFARAARSLLSIAAKLNAEQPGDREDWRAVFGRSRAEEHGYPVPSYDSNLEREWVLLASELERWFRLGNVRPVLHASDEGLEIELLSVGLFPAIAKRLVFTIAKHDGVSLCDGCGRPSVPRRNPRSDRRNFCVRCDDAGVPDKLPVRDYRERTRKR